MRPKDAKVSLLAGASQFALEASRDNSPCGMTEMITCLLCDECLPHPRLCVCLVPWRGRGAALPRPLQKFPLQSEGKVPPTCQGVGLEGISQISWKWQRNRLGPRLALGVSEDSRGDTGGGAEVAPWLRPALPG